MSVFDNNNDDDIIALLSSLKEKNISVRLDNDKLRIKGNSADLTDEIKAQLTAKKPQIVEFLATVQQSRLGTGPIPKVEIEGDQELPLSFAQQRLWYIDQLEGPSAHYNMPVALQLNGVLNLAALRKTFDTLVTRHKSLRTVYLPSELHQGEAQQVVQPVDSFEIPLQDISKLDAATRKIKAKELVQEEVDAPFILQQDLMLRVKLIKLQPAEHILMLTMPESGFTYVYGSSSL